jgi:hypothetical protein
LITVTRADRDDVAVVIFRQYIDRIREPSGIQRRFVIDTGGTK